jgi:hypothetical protein
MRNLSERADRPGRLEHNQLGHESELERCNSSHRLHDQQLRHSREWIFGRNFNRHVVHGQRTVSLDDLQLYGRGNGCERLIGAKFSRERDHIFRRGQRELRKRLEFDSGLHAGYDGQL